MTAPIESATPIEMLELLTKTASYTLSPRVGAWLPAAIALARSPLSIIGLWQRRAARKAQRQIVEQLLNLHGVELVRVHADWRTGFEVMAYRWGNCGYLVFVGSDDRCDWWQNLTDPTIGRAAFDRNADAVWRIAQSLRCDTIHATGHSLGGAQALRAYAAIPRIDSCTTFQTAVPAEDLRRSRADYRPRHYLHRDDLVPYLSTRRAGGDYRQWRRRIGGSIYEYAPPDRYRGTRRADAHTMQIAHHCST